MGKVMSGTESSASCVRSVNSTSEWMMLSGWTTTSILSGGTSKSQRASMTSSPLFIIVALSIVILRPIDHFGWLRASATVTASKSTSGRNMKGPPEAVRIRRRMTSDAGAPSASPHQTHSGA